CMPTLHKYVGETVAAIFGVLFIWGTIFWIRNKNPGSFFWGLLGVGQVLLGLQVLFGVILLAMGKQRVWLHYSYGLFSVFVLYAAHRISKRFEGVEWAVFALGSLVVFGLLVRAYMTGI